MRTGTFFFGPFWRRSTRTPSHSPILEGQDRRTLLGEMDHFQQDQRRCWRAANDDWKLIRSRNRQPTHHSLSAAASTRARAWLGSFGLSTSRGLAPRRALSASAYWSAVRAATIFMNDTEHGRSAAGSRSGSTANPSLIFSIASAERRCSSGVSRNRELAKSQIGGPLVHIAAGVVVEAQRPATFEWLAAELL